MVEETYMLISHFHSLYIYIYFFILFIKLYLDLMNDSNKSKFDLHLNYPGSTSKSVRRLLKIWETSACNLINVSEAVLHAF